MKTQLFHSVQISSKEEKLWLLHVYDGYAVILNYNGILIYDMNNEAVVDTIDNAAIGLNKIQGSEYTFARATDENIAFANTGNLEESAYVYDIKNKKLEKSGEKQVKELYNIKYVTDAAIVEKIIISEGNAIYDKQRNIITLTYDDPNTAYSWKLTKWDSEGKEVLKEMMIFKK